MGGESHQSPQRTLIRIGLGLEGYGDGCGRGKCFYRDTWVLVSKQKDWGFSKISEGDHLRDLNIWVGNGVSVWVEGECQINWGIGGHSVSPHQASG